MHDPEELQEFDLDDILNEFRPEEGEETAEETAQAEEAPAAGPEESQESAEAPAAEEAPAQEKPEPLEPVPASAEPTQKLDEVVKAAAEAPEATADSTIRLEKLEDIPAPAEAVPQEEAAAEEEPEPVVIELDPKARLRELKRKLIAGPEKRYYELSEQGLGSLQTSVILNLVIVALCAAATALFSMELIPDNRLRLVIFSQVLAMLISALLGTNQLLDGLGEIFKGRFTINTMLFMSFVSCCVDAVFCLRDLRIPCCAAFSLEMALALWGRYHRRATEMAQMDTLRKAVRLHGLVKQPDFMDGKPGLLRTYGNVDHFLDNYRKPSGPEKFQSIYSFAAFLICVAIAVYAGVNHGVSMAFQILSTSLLVAVPASYFISLTRPMAVLQNRLHMVGTVLCGWQGVKGLKKKAVFPLKDQDLFPNGSTKLNGVKFYGDRLPDEVVSYSCSLITAAGGGLVGAFRQLLISRGVREQKVTNLRYYAGGVGGEVNGESVLLGSLSFLQDMGVEIPQGTMVNQAVYAAIDGELGAVVAISYAKMRSASGGLVSLCSSRKITTVMTGGDFMLTESLIRSRFGVSTKRMVFPDRETRLKLSKVRPSQEVTALALSTREDLISYAYAISGARALRSACILGTLVHVLGGFLGILIMAALAYLGSTDLLTPTNVLLYQLIWLFPGLLITEWTRAV